jgi:hypothetical protein
MYWGAGWWLVYLICTVTDTDREFMKNELRHGSGWTQSNPWIPSTLKVNGIILFGLSMMLNCFSLIKTLNASWNFQGDHKQLQPRRENRIPDFSEKSFMNYLMEVGVAVYRLAKQHRMVPDLFHLQVQFANFAGTICKICRHNLQNLWEVLVL